MNTQQKSQNINEYKTFAPLNRFPPTKPTAKFKILSPSHPSIDLLSLPLTEPQRSDLPVEVVSRLEIHPSDFPALRVNGGVNVRLVTVE